MTIESTNDNNSTNPAITYSECYAQVFLGDCLELYKNIEPKSIDLILTDLPYGTTACKWDTIIPFDKLWKMVNYLLKPNGAFITTASQPFTSALVMSNPKMFKYEWIWEKNYTPNFAATKRVPQKRHEQILVFYKDYPTYNEQRIPKNEASLARCKYSFIPTKFDKENVYGKFGFQDKQNDINFRHPTEQHPHSIIFFGKDKNAHPTQKPLSLFEYLLKTYSNENMIIFDPCMGSGTTGVACKNLNRNFIGIEKDEGYFKIAEQRINARTLFS